MTEMADSQFQCPSCNQPLQVSDEMWGQVVACPACNYQVQIPAAAPATASASRPPPLPTIFCSKCGHKNLAYNLKCVLCGALLHEQPARKYAVTDDGTMGGLIPYKNAQSLWAYYLAIFSLIPCLGVPLGIAAVILGIRGLKYAELHPEAKGKGHCWTGIILGAFCSLGYLLLILVLVMAGAFK